MKINNNVSKKNNILLVRVEVTVVLEGLQYMNTALAVAVRWIGRNKNNKV